MAGIDGITSMTNTYLNSLQSNTTSNIESGKDYTKASDEELMEACKEFESYFLEQVFKAMKDTVPKQEEDSAATYGMFEDNLYQEYAKQAADSGQLGLAQKLFDQMKLNYKLD